MGSRVELAGLRHRALQFGADGPDEIALFLDEAGVVDVEDNQAASGESADLRAGAASPDDDQVLAQRLHVLLLVFAEAEAESDQQNDGGDSPDDSEHGEEAAHFVGAQGGNGLLE